ncbi:MAG: NADH-quinone oxidoreductase subunit J [Gammaproteobacteria bacterium]
MLLQEVIFYVFAAMLIISALLVVGLRNPIYAALALVAGFFATSVLWILLEAEFLALILLLVYVGAVMTLFLFVVMMLNLDQIPKSAGFVKYTPLGVLVLGVFVITIFYIISPKHFPLGTQAAPALAPENYSNVKSLGMVLYTQYVYPFELAAVLLLVAIIAAISLSLHKTRAKKQNIKKQLFARSDKRVHLVDIPVEKRE